MNLEFHYYVTHWLALKAGFPSEEARLIASSCQQVDRAILGYTVVHPGGRYDTAVTQDYGYWERATLRDIYLPFHFIPGGPEAPPPPRLDGAKNPWSVVADSPASRAILERGLKTRDPYRVGIALHAYADGWAHQGFSGKEEAWNALEGGGPIPPAGHAQALQAPDGVGGRWTDSRLRPELSRIVNRQRFIRAAEMMYRYLRTYLRRDFSDWSLVGAELQEIWGRPGEEKETKERIYDYIISAGIAEYDSREWMEEAGVSEEGFDGELGFSGYDKLLWLKREISSRLGLGKRRTVFCGDSFTRGRWYLWNEAAYAHRREALEVIESMMRQGATHG